MDYYRTVVDEWPDYEYTYASLCVLIKINKKLGRSEIIPKEQAIAELDKLKIKLI